MHMLDTSFVPPSLGILMRSRRRAASCVRVHGRVSGRLLSVRAVVFFGLFLE
jgi:hypothetical protein